MAVEVEDQFNRLSLHYPLDFILDQAYFWMLLGLFQMPTPIQIESIKIASVVTQKHSIYIHHRKDIKIVLRKQELIFLRRSQ